MRIVLIVGLPGSGKTHFANQIRKVGEKMGDEVIVVDDIVNLNQLPSTCGTLVITDVNFCDTNIRASAHVALKQKYGNDVPLLWFFYENNVDKCRGNVLLS